MKIKIKIFTIFLSIIFIFFSAYFFFQANYNNKVKKYFLNKVPVTTEMLKNISLSSDKNVLITGIVSPENFFLTESGKKVVAHYHKEEIGYKKSNKWKELKDATFFRSIPFTLNDKNGYVVIDNVDIDKNYLCKKNIKTENLEKDKIKQISECFIEVNTPITVFGRVENKVGQIIITNPNIGNPFLSIIAKEPFIVTSYPIKDIVKKASQISLGIYFVTLAVFIIGAFSFINSIIKLMKIDKTKKKDEDEDEKEEDDESFEL